MFNFVIEAHLFKFAMLVVYSGFTTLCGRYFGDIGGANLHGGTYFSCINICLLYLCAYKHLVFLYLCRKLLLRI